MAFRWLLGRGGVWAKAALASEGFGRRTKTSPAPFSGPAAHGYTRAPERVAEGGMARPI